MSRRQGGGARPPAHPAVRVLVFLALACGSWAVVIWLLLTVYRVSWLLGVTATFGASFVASVVVVRGLLAAGSNTPGDGHRANRVDG